MQIAFASTFNIENAKIGSTILKDYSSYPYIIVGHAGVVINEYNRTDDWDFIVEAAPTDEGFETHTSYEYFLNKNMYLGHYRAKALNYTFKERDAITEAAKDAIITRAKYSYFFLYKYNKSIHPTREHSIPYSESIIPTRFRCDGLAEWSAEVSLNPTSPREIDGFYRKNTFKNIPLKIQDSPIDAIGTPDAPTLTLTDTDVNASFPAVSGAWSKALYALYRSTFPYALTAERIYCGNKRSYKDKITDDMSGEYYYYLKVGERTASCDDTETDFSDFSEYSSIDINKTDEDENQSSCPSPELFEVVSQTDINTSDWRVTVKNKETNETQEDVYPFNLEDNGSLYQLENDDNKWVLASCGGTTIDSNWTGQLPHEFHQLDNPQNEKIVGENLCPSPQLFEIVSHTNQNTIDWRVSVRNKETEQIIDNVLPFNLNGSLYPLENGELVIASCGGTAYTTEWLGQNVDTEFYKLDNGEIIKANPTRELIYYCRKWGSRDDYTDSSYYVRRLSCHDVNANEDITIIRKDYTSHGVVGNPDTLLTDAMNQYYNLELYDFQMDQYFQNKLTEATSQYGENTYSVVYKMSNFDWREEQYDPENFELQCTSTLTRAYCRSYKVMFVRFY